MRKSSLLLLVTCLTAVPVHAAGFELELSEWGADLGMNARLDSGTLAGTEFNLKDDIGVDGEEGVQGLQAMFKLGNNGRHRFMVAYAQSSYAGSNVLDRAITIDDTTYAVSESVALDMDFAVARAYYSIAVVNGDKLQVGLQQGVLAVFSDGVFSASVSPDEEFDGVAPLPVVGLNLQFQPTPRHRVSAFVNGMSLEVGDVDGSAMEYEAQYKFFPVQWLGIGVGLRALELDAEIADEGLVDLENDGVFFNATFRW